MVQYEQFKGAVLYAVGRAGGSYDLDALLEEFQPEIDPLDFHLHVRRLRQEALVEPMQGRLFLNDKGWDWLAANRHRLPRA